jgi:hypothetical protein
MTMPILTRLLSYILHMKAITITAMTAPISTPSSPGLAEEDMTGGIGIELHEAKHNDHRGGDHHGEATVGHEHSSCAVWMALRTTRSVSGLQERMRDISVLDS